VREQSDTRSRIQEVALELFTDHGYEATSLREIAERLGVTKAALYYHFKTKEDIVASLMEDRVAELEELTTWARTQPRTAAGRMAIVERYASDMHHSNQHKVMRFLERNQTALREHPKSERTRELLLELIDVLSPPEADLPTRLRTAMSIFTLHAVWFMVPGPEFTDDDRRAAALKVALELVDRPPAPAAHANPLSPTVGAAY
jgi:AcrR family transcriptional regulator